MVALRFDFLRTANIPTSMYGNHRSVKRNLSCASVALRFLVGIYRGSLWFGRFRPQLSHSNALHEFANHVRLLTALVRSFPISPCPLLGTKTNEPVVIRMLLRMSESSIFKDCSREFQ